MTAMRSLDAGHRFHTGPRLAYVPTLQVLRGDAGLLASEAQVQWLLAWLEPVARGLALEASAGPVLAWFRVLPIQSQAGTVGQPERASRINAMFSAQLGPRVALASGLSLSAQIGCSVIGSRQLEFGFRDPEGRASLSVFRMRRLRWFLEVGARIGL